MFLALKYGEKRQKITILDIEDSRTQYCSILWKGLRSRLSMDTQYDILRAAHLYIAKQKQSFVARASITLFTFEKFLKHLGTHHHYPRNHHHLDHHHHHHLHKHDDNLNLHHHHHHQPHHHHLHAQAHPASKHHGKSHILCCRKQSLAKNFAKSQMFRKQNLNKKQIFCDNILIFSTLGKCFYAGVCTWSGEIERLRWSL